jgi:hypothetical protein
MIQWAKKNNGRLAKIFQYTTEIFATKLTTKDTELPSVSWTCGRLSFTHWKDGASLHPLDFIKKAVTTAADLKIVFQRSIRQSVMCSW